MKPGGASVFSASCGGWFAKGRAEGAGLCHRRTVSPPFLYALILSGHAEVRYSGRRPEDTNDSLNFTSFPVIGSMLRGIVCWSQRMFFLTGIFVHL